MSATQIAYYRDRCTPKLTQEDLALHLRTHINTIKRWEKLGVSKPAALQRMLMLFIEHGAIADLATVERFWRGSSSNYYPLPPEVQQLFSTPLSLPIDTLPHPDWLPQHSLLPLRRNRLFVGRTSDLLTIAKALPPLGATVAICGIAGIGKTQIACELAHRYGRFFAGGVFWVNCADPTGLPAEIAACGGAEGLALGAEFDNLPSDQQVRRVLAEWRMPVSRLLIFDNCEDEHLLAQWRPTSGGSRVIVTSRRTRWDRTLVSHEIPLGTFSRRESVALLHGHYGDLLHGMSVGEATSFDIALDAVAAELGDLPLALHLAGKYLAHRYPHILPMEYWAQLHTSTQHGIFPNQILASDGPSPTWHHQQVDLVFSLSYMRLNPSNMVDRLASDLLVRAAYFAPGEPIPRKLLLASAQEKIPIQLALFEQALARLIGDLGMLDSGVDGALRMHRLVSLCLRSAHSDNAARAAVERVLTAESERMSNTSTAVPTVVLQHIRYVTASARQRADTQSLALSDALVRQLYLHRDYASALPVIEWVIHTRTAQFGPQHPILIANLEMMAESQHMLGNTLLARDYFEQALHICDHSLSREDPVRLVAYNEFGYSTLFSGGDFRRAYRYLREVVTVRHRTLGLTNGETARSIRNFGYAQIVFGRYHAARRYLVLALRIFEHLHPDFELAKAQTLMHIGEASLLLNDLDNARSYHEQSLAIRQRLRPTNDTDIAESHWHLGRVALAAGSLTIAETHLTCARTMHGSAPEPGNLYYLARVHDALGELELARNQPIRALPCLEQSLALWLRMVGEQHPCTAAVIEHLGDLAAMQADAASADGYYQRALSIIDHLFGVDHPNGKRLRLTR